MLVPCGECGFCFFWETESIFVTRKANITEIFGTERHMISSDMQGKYCTHHLVGERGVEFDKYCNRKEDSKKYFIH